MAVHQLIPRFASGDALAQAALHFQVLLRRLGHWGQIYAAEVEHGLSALARPASTLKPLQDDRVLFHHGAPSPLAGVLLHVPCNRGVICHGMASPEGRAQLAAMAGHVELGIGVSDLTAAELEVAGFSKPKRVPLFVEPNRFGADRADPGMLARLARGAPTLVSVTPGLPHERVEDLLALHAELRRLEHDARLLIVGPRLGREPKGVYFLDRLTHAERVAAYRSAAVYVSMSEYEGFGLPLVEAMAAEVPVMAFAAGAVPETLGAAGIAFTEKRFAFLAELVRELTRDTELRRKLLAGQRRRLAVFTAAASERALADALGAERPRPRSSRAKSKPRVAIVVQRYGDVSGGAEAHARAVAHRMSAHWKVSILTSCAKDHLTWANELEPGESTDGPVRVLRFASERVRDMRAFNRLSRAVFGKSNDRLHEEHWIAEQGPSMPGLLRHLSEEGPLYDGFVAFTYLYEPTVWGLPLVAQRALLVPTAHDEPPLGFDAYADAFERPRAILCNTPEEEALIRGRFPKAARSRVVGVGIDAVRANAARFRKRFQVGRPYLLYVGRIEPGKDIPELLAFHAALRRADEDAPDLLLAGTLSMRVGGDGVRHLGRIEDADKFDAIAGAQAVVVPSRYESLSLLALEAFAQAVPVVANGRSAVLTGQVERSRAGVLYSDAASFIEAIEWASAQRLALGRRGKAFARKHRWSNVIDVYREEMDGILRAR